MSTAGTTRVRWTRRMHEDFFEALAATCHVQQAAAAIGVKLGSVYYQRRIDPGFAAGWRDALAHGYEILETRVVGHALRGGGTELTGSDPDYPPVDIDLAMRLLREHHSRMTGSRVTPGRPAGFATREETNAAILKKLKAIEAQQARKVRKDGTASVAK